MKLSIFGACSRQRSTSSIHGLVGARSQQRSTSPLPGLVASILMSVAPILAAADASSASAAPHARAAFHAVGPLDASQLQAIRIVSRSVLGAKRGQISDAGQIALRDEVKALSVSIDEALAPRAASVTLLNKESAESSAQTSRARGEDRFAAVRSRLSSLRERRRQGGVGNGRADHVAGVRTQDLVAKAGKLDAEVQAALDAPPAERPAKLRELRSRLQVQGQYELMMERRAAADARQKTSGKKQFAPPPETPTISTIVKHR